MTDHKPLTTTLSLKAGLFAFAVACLQRWAIILSAYNYDIMFCPIIIHANADYLSRLPLDNVSSQATASLQQIRTLPVTPQHLRSEKVKDPFLLKVLATVHQERLAEDFCPFYKQRLELTIECGCLMWACGA